MDNIVLIGFMGSGKTGVGRELARLLSIPFYDKSGNASAAVYSTGGGIVTRKENIPFLKKLGTVVLFKVSPGTVIERIGNDASRPMLAGSGREKRVRELMLLRTPMYLACADIVLAMDGYSKEENALRTKIVLQEHGCL